MQEKEIYIGKGQTIKAKPNEKYINYLDINKLEKIVEENPNKEIYCGASVDWYWTATKIKDIEKIKTGEEYCLMHSNWDTFIVEIDGKRINCNIEVPIDYARIVATPAYIEGINNAQFWLSNIYIR